ncbi:Scr1 family TA system antitoxin-like transcriptional regulator [Streptomyces sp. FXJ1.172]|uniref:Scr1 family TA system antitoxin-like transcriptional regulator n=1 Tax=Streptomyces sp. FXJ1.172 TaxID=710705 RepID=UPI0007CF2988|nr:Scr1 family TA system antitoxin-like transcriptional regulator [Streptomyces sp. FXJ1.172]WEO96365.1 Scr1 family TA system antitoxin-like transcriptional regulator [Streptomyces sp. FXJ1.172]
MLNRQKTPTPAVETTTGPRFERFVVEASRLPNVKLQVVPFIAGSHPGTTSAFSIVSFAESGAMDVVYMDTASSTLWLESEEDEGPPQRQVRANRSVRARPS